MRWLLFLGLTLLAGCAPQWLEPGEPVEPPTITPHAYVTPDGVALPLRIWPAQGKLEAVVLALHGMNDHSTAFALPAAFWAARGVTTYAYDQRGFGGAPHHGRWPGANALVVDAKRMAAQLRARHPGVPLYLLGESMGAAIALLATSGPAPAPVDGAILSAPAVWGGNAMSLVYRLPLWFAAHLMPQGKVSGRGLQRWASDNVEVLRGLGRDPLFIKETRIDTVYGVTGLMGTAYDSAELAKVPLLVLYGARDEIIPPEPVREFIGRLPVPRRVAYYGLGCHMLMRDLEAEAVWRDIRAWIADRAAPLSGGTELPKTAKCRPQGWPVG